MTYSWLAHARGKSVENKPRAITVNFKSTLSGRLIDDTHNCERRHSWTPLCVILSRLKTRLVSLSLPLILSFSLFLRTLIRRGKTPFYTHGKSPMHAKFSRRLISRYFSDPSEYRVSFMQKAQREWCVFLRVQYTATTSDWNNAR